MELPTSSLPPMLAIEFPVVLLANGIAIGPGFAAILGVRGVRPTVLAAAALSCGGRGLLSPMGILVVLALEAALEEEMDRLELVVVVVVVTARTCCKFPKPRGE